MTTRHSLSLGVMIGFLMLMGIVAKNSILLVDFAIEEMRAGKDRLTAMLEAGHKRARPIVMTTVAMVAGMLPVAIGHRRRQRLPRSHGDRGHRRTHHLYGADAGDRAGSLHADRRHRALARAQVRPRAHRATDPRHGRHRNLIRPAEAHVDECHRQTAGSSRPASNCSPAGALGVVGAAVGRACRCRCCTALPIVLGWLAFRVFPYREHVVRENLTHGLSRDCDETALREVDARLLPRLRADVRGDRQVGDHGARRRSAAGCGSSTSRLPRELLAQGKSVLLCRGAPVQLGVDAARAVARAGLPGGCRLQAAGGQLGRARDEDSCAAASAAA